jgi:preprotein translocase subunit SecY
VYAVLILFFAYFYTYTSFSPTEVSMNLKKQGSFIQGIRPAKPTTEYIDANLKPLIFIGSLWMLVIVTIPIVCNGLFNASVSFGGTSIIIVAAVAVEVMTQMKSMTAMYTHKGFVS